MLSPMLLAFLFGLVAKLIRSGFSLPKDLYAGLSIHLLWSLGLSGGIELAHASFDRIAMPALVTLLLGCVTPVVAWAMLRYRGKFSEADSAGMRCALWIGVAGDVHRREHLREGDGH